MTVRRAVANIRSDRSAETRDFYVDLLGFEVAMDMGWVMTVVSRINPSAQITIVVRRVAQADAWPTLAAAA